MDKIVIQSKEVEAVGIFPEQPGHLAPKLESPVSLSARVGMSLLVLVLPLLCLVTLAMRLAMRGLPPRTRYAWLDFLSSLLIVSGLLTSLAFVAMVATGMTGMKGPSVGIPGSGAVTGSLRELDSRREFPALPAAAPLAAQEVAGQLKSLVVVLSPAQKLWFGNREMPGGSLGSGIILEASDRGYLIMTALHVATPAGAGDRMLVAAQSGEWASGRVIARHNALDLALVWLPRREGHSTFVLPIRDRASVREGENIFVIGHPQGLRFTLSTGIVSRKTDDALQISAPVSPGNSGGPAFDDRGGLVGIVTSMIDRGSNPNAENLNFAVAADEVLRAEVWKCAGDGSSRLEEFQRLRKQRTADPGGQNR